MPAFDDITGLRFGRWTAIERAGKEFAWHCLCDCGNAGKVFTSSLKSGKSASCGCLLREVASERAKVMNRTHGQSKTQVYKVWHSMRGRCEDSRVKNYAEYGGRGIKVCERWSKFENFIADMGPRPAGTSLDRKDNDGHYEPGNCRWATRTEQNRNSRRNKTLTHGGQTLCIAEWADVTGISEAILRQRLSLGWTVERTLTEDVKPLPRKLLTFRGKTQNAAAWCAELGLPLATVRSRVFKGWTDEAALTTPVRPKRTSKSP